jgi:hypothetical protein
VFGLMANPMRCAGRSRYLTQARLSFVIMVSQFTGPIKLGQVNLHQNAMYK